MIVNRFRFTSLAYVAMLGALVAGPALQMRAQSSGKCSLTVRVTGIRNTEGNIRLVLRRDENSVIEVKQVEIDAKTMTAQAVFDGVPDRTYGVAVIHDENKNGKLDMNEMGVPLEGYGHSNNPAKRMGPPSFDETTFALHEPGTSIEIRLIYWM
jgi:uncharacterized protein (DUF2141 family)